MENFLNLKRENSKSQHNFQLFPNREEMQTSPGSFISGEFTSHPALAPLELCKGVAGVCEKFIDLGV